MDIGEFGNGARTRRSVAAALGIATLVVSLLVTAPASAGQRLVVDDDGAECGPTPHASIGSAVESASDGDTIIVCPGLYAERVHVTKSVRIIGPVDAIGRFDCFVSSAASPGDLDLTRFAVLEPPPPASTEASAPVLTLDADGVELAGMVIQGVIDQTPVVDSGSNLYVPAVASSDAHSGYRIHHNVFRSNTLGMEFGSSGAAVSRFDHNCVRENRFGAANQRLGLANAVIDSNGLFRIAFAGLEVGWAYRGAERVTVRENVIRGVTYPVFIENSNSVRVADNDVDSFGIRGIWVSAGNRDIEIRDNIVRGGDGLAAASAGIIVTGPTPALSRSVGVAIRGNVVSAVRVTGADGSVFGFGIVLAANSSRDALVADNTTFDNGQAGIVVFNNNLNNLLRDNLSYDNAWYGIRIQLDLSAGNVVRDNEMSGNGRFDASDTSDTNPADGIQLRNTWVDNTCVTDELAGAICGTD